MKDFKYIIKRIIIGTGIALLLMLIKGNFLLRVNAQNIYTTNWGYQNFNPTYDQTDVGFDVQNLWVNEGDANILFSFQVTSVPGNNAKNVRSVLAHVGDNLYVCNVGSVMNPNAYLNGGDNYSTNSTTVYSATCPVHLDSNGLSHITVTFNPGGNPGVNYNVYFSYQVSMQKLTSPDNSSVVQAIDDTTDAINDASNNEIESQKVCKNLNYDEKQFHSSIGYLQSDGTLNLNSNYLYTSDFMPVGKNSTLALHLNGTGNALSYCLYNSDNSLISCTRYNGSSNITVNTGNAFSIRVSYTKIGGFTLTGYTCINGNQAVSDAIQSGTDAILDDNVNDATSEASSFFDDFTGESHGISGIITAPLRLINALTTAQCTPLRFQLPFVHNEVVLPCMRSIYETHFGVFFSLYQLITTGLICYATMINLYSKIHNLQNPYNDRIEVLNL